MPISAHAVGFEEVDRELAAIPIELRGPIMTTALRKGAQVVIRRAKPLVPPPGYPGDKPDLKPLRETLGVVTRTYRTVVMALAGPRWPAGAHGHLVEQSHRHFAHGEFTGEMTEAKPFIEPASESTRSQQDMIVRRAADQAIQKARR